MTMDPRSASTAKKKAPGIFLSSFCVIIYVRIVTDNEISSGSIQLSYSNIVSAFKPQTKTCIYSTDLRRADAASAISEAV